MVCLILNFLQTKAPPRSGGGKEEKQKAKQLIDRMHRSQCK